MEINFSNITNQVFIKSEAVKDYFTKVLCNVKDKGIYALTAGYQSMINQVTKNILITKEENKLNKIILLESHTPQDISKLIVKFLEPKEIKMTKSQIGVKVMGLLVGLLNIKLVAQQYKHPKIMPYEPEIKALLIGSVSTLLAILSVCCNKSESIKNYNNIVMNVMIGLLLGVIGFAMEMALTLIGERLEAQVRG